MFRRKSRPSPTAQAYGLILPGDSNPGLGERLARDPAGNTLAFFVLLGMLLPISGDLVGWQVWGGKAGAPGFPGYAGNDPVRSPVFDLPDIPGAIRDWGNLCLVLDLGAPHVCLDGAGCDSRARSIWRTCRRIASHTREGGLISRFQLRNAWRMAWSSQVSTSLVGCS